MKKCIVSLVLISLVISCHEPRDQISDTRISKSIGKRISIEVAERWVNNHKTKGAYYKTLNSGLNAVSLQSSLQPMSEKLGIILHHAIDDYGQHRILFIPLEEDEPLWSAQSVIDGNGELIGSSMAEKWAERFRNENPESIWAHFFGIHVFEEILSKDGFKQMDIVPAINDEGVPQLLLYVWRNVQSNGRTQGEDLSVYDKSTDCPPCDI